MTPILSEAYHCVYQILVHNVFYWLRGSSLLFSECVDYQQSLDLENIIRYICFFTSCLVDDFHGKMPQIKNCLTVTVCICIINYLKWLLAFLHTHTHILHLSQALTHTSSSMNQFIHAETYSMTNLIWQTVFKMKKKKTRQRRERVPHELKHATHCNHSQKHLHLEQFQQKVLTSTAANSSPHQQNKLQWWQTWLTVSST